MKYEELAAIAMDNQDVMCYIADVETFEILYINETSKKNFGYSLEESFIGTKCHKFFSGKDIPCATCNNSILSSGRQVQRIMQSEINRKFYTAIDTIITVGSRKLRLTFAYDAALHEEEYGILAGKLLLEETLVKCIRSLVEDEELGDAINKLLSLVGYFYLSDRSYIFEVDHVSQTVKNTYEWCELPELSTIKHIPELKFNDVNVLLEGFNEYGEVLIKNIDFDLNQNTKLYKLLHETQRKSLLLVPLFKDKELKYFIGVDNPKRMLNDLSLLHSVSIFLVSAFKKEQIVKELEHLSYRDILTGLYNRNKYIARLEEMDVKAIRSLGFIHVTVNGLKNTNELYGERYGDEILKKIAKILSSHIRGELYRLSGDEFIALCSNISENDFNDLVTSLRQEESNYNELSYAVGGVWQNKKIDIHQGLSHAFDIMLAEKQKFYKGKSDGKVQMRSNPVEILLNEIKQGIFSIYLQPKVELKTGKIVGAEALVRKKNSTGYVIFPDRFVSVYENEGTIRHVDFFVLEQVCILLEQLIAEDKAFPIAVNFSRVTFIASDLVEEIVKTCNKYNVPHCYIKIELTESIEKMNYDFFKRKIRDIKNAGFSVSLDDFGAKQSNLLMLTVSEFSEVKIDRGLVENLTSSSQNRIVLRNIIKTIMELGISICVAEGIETKEQKEMLEDFGCLYGQGYYFYRPMPIDTFLEIYENDQGKIESENKDNEENLAGCEIKINDSLEIYDNLPIGLNIWNHTRNTVACNQYLVELFELDSKKEYTEKFYSLSPEKQPNGLNSKELSQYYVNEARNNGYIKFKWLHCKLNGEKIPCEVILKKLNIKDEYGDYIVIGFTKDMRSFSESVPKLEAKIDYNLRYREMEAILETMPLGLNLWNQNYENVACNNFSKILFDLDSKEQYLTNFFKLSPEKQPDGTNSIEFASKYIKEAQEKGFAKFYWLHCKLNGEEIPCEIILYRLDSMGRDGNNLVAGFTRDLRPQLAGHEQSEISEGFYFNQVSDKILITTIAELTAEWFWVYDNRTAHIQFFGKGREILDLPTERHPFPESIIDRNMVYKDDVDTFLAMDQAFRKGLNRPTEVRFNLPDGSNRYFKIVYKNIYDNDGKPMFSIGKTYDIDEQKSLKMLSQTDLLTNTYNKITTEKFIKSIIYDYRKLSHVLFIMDIDDFKGLNDRMGHQIGDLILKEIGKNLHSCFRDGDIIGRIGGDEFIVFVKNLDNLGIIKSKAEAIVRSFGSIGDEDYAHIEVSGSVGIALYPQDGLSYEELYKNADVALYQSKKLGKNCYSFYSKEDDV